MDYFIFNDILSASKLPKIFKRANVISILKPVKDDTEPAHYRPISLLSVTYQLLERMVLANTEAVPNRCWHSPHTSKVSFSVNSRLASCLLTWQRRMILCLEKWANTKVHECCLLLDNMLVNRYFQVFLGDKSSRLGRLNNGLPQGSVLAPILLNLYMSDIPLITFKQFLYADEMHWYNRHERLLNCLRLRHNNKALLQLILLLQALSLNHVKFFFIKWRSINDFKMQFLTSRNVPT
jgi:hypothetical protein